MPNDVRRYSLGTKNKDLETNADGSLTIYVQADPPPDAQRSNWLPAPKDADFSLFTYWDWLFNNGALVLASSALVEEFLKTFKDSPPRQKAASFTIDQPLEKMQSVASGAMH